MLKSLLSAKFPTFQFSYTKFSAPTSKSDLYQKTKPAGIILELKALKKNSLSTLDKLWRRIKDFQTIVVVTPEGYKLLRDKRPQLIQKASLLLSELKSLDYVVQLPRLVEDIATKNRLRSQNERLKRMAEKKLGAEAAFLSQRPTIAARSINQDIFEEATERSLCGLHVSLKKWDQVKRRLGDTAQSEILEAVGRMINSTVRNSDRVLRWKEDEFLVFLSNAEPKHLTQCRDRIERLLKGMKLKSNEQDLSMPFAVKSLEKMAFLN